MFEYTIYNMSKQYTMNGPSGFAEDDISMHQSYELQHNMIALNNNIDRLEHDLKYFEKVSIY